MEKIYILGNGAMATAIAEGVKDSYEVVIVSRRPFESEFKNEIYGDSYDIGGKNIILAFKPYALEDVSQILKNRAKICISVLAKTSVDKISKFIQADSHAVCIPNLAAKYKSSITPYLLSTQADKNEIVKILTTFGSTLETSDDKSLNVASVLAGCAPAYLCIVAESLANAGVLEGLKSSDSATLVRGLFESFSKLLQNSHPVQIKESVCSPAGTTIEGVYELEKGNVRTAFINALKASVKKQGK